MSNQLSSDLRSPGRFPTVRHFCSYMFLPSIRLMHQVCTHRLQWKRWSKNKKVPHPKNLTFVFPVPLQNSKESLFLLCVWASYYTSVRPSWVFVFFPLTRLQAWTLFTKAKKKKIFSMRQDLKGPSVIVWQTHHKYEP